MFFDWQSSGKLDFEAANSQVEKMRLQLAPFIQQLDKNNNSSRLCQDIELIEHAKSQLVNMYTSEGRQRVLSLFSCLNSLNKYYFF